MEKEWLEKLEARLEEKGRRTKEGKLIWRLDDLTREFESNTRNNGLFLDSAVPCGEKRPKDAYEWIAKGSNGEYLKIEYNCTEEKFAVYTHRKEPKPKENYEEVVYFIEERFKHE
jgi:hypothetical protein